MNKLSPIKNRIICSSPALTRNSLRKVLSSGVMILILTTAAAYAQPPNQVSDDGGKTWHPYGQSQSSSSNAGEQFNVNTPGFQQAEALNNQTIAAIARGDNNSAVRSAEEALRLLPTSRDLRANLAQAKANVASDKHDYTTALYYSEEALRIDPCSFRQHELSKMKAEAGAYSASAAGQTKSGRTANHSTVRTVEAPAGSGLPNVNVTRFEKSRQLPPPPSLKGDLPSDPAKRAAVKQELDKYMKTWNTRNQVYQKAPPKEAAQIKDQMETDNKKFKARLTKDYAVTF